MLGVEQDLKALAAQEQNRVFDHPQVLVERSSDRSGHLEVGRLSDDACGRRFGCDQLTDDGVRVGRRGRAARGAEACDLRRLQAQLGNAAEELDVLRVRPGPAAFDVVDADLVEPPRDLQLVVNGQR